MLVLFEMPAGFALSKFLNEGKLYEIQDLSLVFSSADAARKVVTLKVFPKFENTIESLEAASCLIDGKSSTRLRKFLHAHCDNEILVVADSKMGYIIKVKLKIDCVHKNAAIELMRGVRYRYQLTKLISGLVVQDMAPMSLGLYHSLSRYKLKFSGDKMDTMIVQAIGLLDNLDKELNTYAMRVREWYGLHFLELTKIIQDDTDFAKSTFKILHPPKAPPPKPPYFIFDYANCIIPPPPPTMVLNFFNSILLLGQLNQVVVIAISCNSCSYVYGSSSNKNHTSTNDTMPAFYSNLLHNLDKFIGNHKQLTIAHEPGTVPSSLLFGSFSKALYYRRRTFCLGPMYPQPWILCLQGSLMGLNNTWQS
ncbi:unnamed protein product [Lathyrus sativus]|nr:unnamed protein product [Lathyrus sativus]